MNEIKRDDPISELTPDGMAKSWFAMALAGVLGFVMFVQILLFALR